MVACLAAACSSELPDVGEPASATLGFEPEAPADAVPPIVRLEVASTEANPSSMRLFQGELSDYYLGRIRSGELPETLLQREIPTLAFASDEGATVVPTQSLEEGVYALASPELGLIGAFNISAASSLPILRRLWPPAAEFGTYAAYCGSSVPTLAVEVTLEPSSVGALLSPGLGTDGLLAERCLRLELEQPLAEGALVLPPVVTGGATLEQAPLLGAVPIDARDPECGAGELALGPGCISVADDRLFLRSDRALLWLFHEPSEAVVVLETAGQRVMSGLAPSSTVSLSGEAVEVSGARVAFRLQVTTLPAVPRVVLNEVLANAAGAEPAQEWIELVNDGAAMVNLEGYQLQDAGGSNVLPAFELGAGEFALLVSDEYLPDPAVDVPPAPGAHLVVLPALGKNGLSNTGELLRLFDAQGLLVSSFPALRSSNAGVSLARRSPSAADDDAAAFGPHAAPGASPGAPNVLSER